MGLTNVIVVEKGLAIECKYFGKELGSSEDYAVKDTCPPPQNNGMYYFVLDLDSGSAASITMRASLLSPAETPCVEGTCLSETLPGYDVYVSESCLPLPDAEGSTIGGAAPNEDFNNEKKISLEAKSFTRYYLGLSQKPGIGAGNPSCSFKLFPGTADEGSMGSCSISDYSESLGIRPCDPPISRIDIWIIVAAVACGMFLSLAILLLCRWRERKKLSRQMMAVAERQLAKSIAAVCHPWHGIPVLSPRQSSSGAR
jgi:hypothetical protein